MIQKIHWNMTFKWDFLFHVCKFSIKALPWREEVDMEKVGKMYRVWGGKEVERGSSCL